MNDLVCIHDKQEIERFARENVYTHIYTIGDLDDFFWPHTLWYGIRSRGRLRALACLYVANTPPTLLLFDDHAETSAELLEQIKSLLPEAFYAHLSPGLGALIEDAYALASHGPFHKMAWRQPEVTRGIKPDGIVPLGEGDLEELLAFYAESYPDNWFDPRMLQTGHYYGLRQGSQLASVAGVHVVSPEYRVAALGNITTHPAFRGRGYARRVTAHLCQSLAQSVDHIGLNVKADNTAALACYRRLGFQTIGVYEELEAKRR